MDTNNGQGDGPTSDSDPREHPLHGGGPAEPTNAAEAPILSPLETAVGGGLIVCAAALLWRDDKVREVFRSVVADPRVREAWTNALTATKDSWNRHCGTEACVRALLTRR